MTHRSEPAQTLRACRHLLRHIDDPRALAANDLAAPVLAEFCHDKVSGGKRRALMYIRGVLRLAASDLFEGSDDTSGRRRRDILLQCDLAGRSHKEVAAELGLSMRQFYRERQIIIAMLSEVLPERMRIRSAVNAAVVDVAALDLARARSLQYGGDFEPAQALLRSIAQSSQHPRTAIEAWAQLASLLVHQGDFSQCRAELHAMRSYLAQCRLDGLDLDFCGERVALERRNLLECSGAIAEARAWDRRGIGRIMGFMEGNDRALRGLAVRALTATARRDFICGDAREARSRLETVCEICSIDEFAPDVHINFLVLYGTLLCVIGNDRGTASSLLSDASVLCERYGLGELAILTVIGRSIEEQMAGNSDRALKQVRSVLPLARRIASPRGYVHVCLRVAELETFVRPRMALTAIDEARRFIAYRTCEWTLAELLSAEAYVRIKDYAAAKIHAENAASAALAEQNLAVEGNALRVLAECYAGMDSQCAAIDAIEASIVRLEHYGHPLGLLYAYRTAAKLTGRSRYTRCSEELTQLLHPA